MDVGVVGGVVVARSVVRLAGWLVMAGIFLFVLAIAAAGAVALRLEDPELDAPWTVVEW